VQRWLRASGAVDRAAPSTIRLRYDGQFRLGEQTSWMPCTSQTYYTTNPPALLWTVDMRMFGSVPIVGRDRYSDMRILSRPRLATTKLAGNWSAGRCRLARGVFNGVCVPTEGSAVWNYDISDHREQGHPKSRVAVPPWWNAGVLSEQAPTPTRPSISVSGG
jgi:hypothetical protein